MKAGPLWRRIADELARGIDMGTYRPEEPLPTAQELSARYGVHRHTVRQAFQYLASQGRVSVEQGRGTFVTSARIPYPVGRHVSFRTNLAKSGIEGRDTLLDSTVTAAEFAPGLRLAKDARVWCIRVLSEAANMPVSMSTHFLPVERFVDFPARFTAHDGSISRAFAAYGIKAYQRLSTRLHARAATLMEAKLLRIPERSPVLHSSGLDATLDVTPLQVVETAFVGDRIEILVEPD